MDIRLTRFDGFHGCQRPCQSGFTLIELMIVVAIISILCAIAIPRFADMVSKAQEGVTKGNLGALRSALSIYYSDNAGTYPTDINSLVQKYISRIPSAYVPPHR